MKIRFLTSIASRTWAFHAGDTLEVTKLTAEVSAWLKSTQGRPPIAEVVKESDEQTAVNGNGSETSVLPQPRRRSRMTD